MRNPDAQCQAPLNVSKSKLQRKAAQQFLQNLDSWGIPAAE